MIETITDSLRLRGYRCVYNRQPDVDTQAGRKLAMGRLTDMDTQVDTQVGTDRLKDMAWT